MAASGDATGPRFVGSVVDPAVLGGGETEPEVHLAPTSGDVAAPANPAPEPAPLRSTPGRESGAALSEDAAPLPTPTPQSAPAAASASWSPVASGGTPDAAEGAVQSDPPTVGELESAPARGSEMRARLLERARSAPTHEAPPGPGERPATGLDEMDPVGSPPVSARDHELMRLAHPARRSVAAPLGPALPGTLSPDMTAIVGTLLGLVGVASIVALAMHVERSLPVTSPGASTSAAPIAVAAVASAAPAAPVQARRRTLIPGPWRIVDDRSQPGVRVIRGTVGKEAFLTAVQAAGLKKSEAYRLPKAFDGVRDLDKCGRSDSFLALVDRATGRLKAFEYVSGPEEVYQARENAEGLLRASRLDLKVGYESFPGAFVIRGAFDASAAAAGFEPGLHDALAKALSGHLDLDELGDGDRLRIIAQEVTVLGAFARYAGIEAIELVPADPRAARRRFYYFKGGTERGYYNAKGQSPFEGGWRRPVPGAPVTSPFNPNRMHPVLHKRMPHQGTDYGAPTGTPVHASSFGKVAFVGWGGPAGNLVRIEHAGKIETLYFHLSRFEAGLKVGDHVDRMQVIGYVGSTGRSTGPHLHFGVKRDGVYVDSATLNLDALRVIANDERAAFSAAVQRYDALLDAIPLPDAPPPAPVAQVSAAPAASEAVEEGDDPEEATSTEPPVVPSAAAAPRGGPAAAVFLTDKELLELQGAASDGEVPE